MVYGYRFFVLILAFFLSFYALADPEESGSEQVWQQGYLRLSESGELFEIVVSDSRGTELVFPIENIRMRDEVASLKVRSDQNQGEGEKKNEESAESRTTNRRFTHSYPITIEEEYYGDLTLEDNKKLSEKSNEVLGEFRRLAELEYQTEKEAYNRERDRRLAEVDDRERNLLQARTSHRKGGKHDVADSSALSLSQISAERKRVQAEFPEFKRFQFNQSEDEEKAIADAVEAERERLRLKTDSVKIQTLEKKLRRGARVPEVFVARLPWLARNEMEAFLLVFDKLATREKEIRPTAIRFFTEVVKDSSAQGKENKDSKDKQLTPIWRASFGPQHPTYQVGLSNEMFFPDALLSVVDSTQERSILYDREAGSFLVLDESIYQLVRPIDLMNPLEKLSRKTVERELVQILDLERMGTPLSEITFDSEKNEIHVGGIDSAREVIPVEVIDSPEMEEEITWEVKGGDTSSKTDDVEEAPLQWKARTRRRSSAFGKKAVLNQLRSILEGEPPVDLSYFMRRLNEQDEELGREIRISNLRREPNKQRMHSTLIGLSPQEIVTEAIDHLYDHLIYKLVEPIDSERTLVVYYRPDADSFSETAQNIGRRLGRALERANGPMEVAFFLDATQTSNIHGLVNDIAEFFKQLSGVAINRIHSMKTFAFSGRYDSLVRDGSSRFPSSIYPEIGNIQVDTPVPNVMKARVLFGLLHKEYSWITPEQTTQLLDSLRSAMVRLGLPSKSKLQKIGEVAKVVKDTLKLLGQYDDWVALPENQGRNYFESAAILYLKAAGLYKVQSYPEESIDRARTMKERMSANSLHHGLDKPLAGVDHLIGDVSRMRVAYLKGGFKTKDFQTFVFFGQTGLGKSLFAEAWAKAEDGEVRYINVEKHPDKTTKDLVELLKEHANSLKMNENLHKFLIVDELDKNLDFFKAIVMPNLSETEARLALESNETQVINFQGITLILIMNHKSNPEAVATLGERPDRTSREYGKAISTLYRQLMKSDKESAKTSLPESAIDPIIGRVLSHTLYFSWNSELLEYLVKKSVQDVERNNPGLRLIIDEESMEFLRRQADGNSVGQARSIEDVIRDELTAAVAAHNGIADGRFWVRVMDFEGRSQRLSLTPLDEGTEGKIVDIQDAYRRVKNDIGYALSKRIESIDAAISEARSVKIDATGLEVLRSTFQGVVKGFEYTSREKLFGKIERETIQVAQPSERQICVPNCLSGAQRMRLEQELTSSIKEFVDRFFKEASSVRHLEEAESLIASLTRTFSDLMKYEINEPGQSVMGNWVDTIVSRVNQHLDRKPARNSSEHSWNDDWHYAVGYYLDALVRRDVQKRVDEHLARTQKPLTPKVEVTPSGESEAAKKVRAMKNEEVARRRADAGIRVRQVLEECASLLQGKTFVPEKSDWDS